MARENDRQRIRDAVNGGLVRRPALRAAPDQVLTYVLSDRQFFPHASIESAKFEKDFLEAALGRQIRMYKVWNTNRKRVHADMTLLRSEAEKLPKQTKFYKSLDRVLESAGF